MKISHLIKAGAPTSGADEVQTLTITGSPDGGTFTLTFGGQETDPIPFDATDDEVGGALEALSTIGDGGVDCTGGPLPDSAVTITFAGALAGLPQNEITADDAELTRTAPDVEIAVIEAGDAENNAMQSMVLSGNPTGGTFDLYWETYNITVGLIAYDATAAEVETAINGTDLNGLVDCTGGPLPNTPVVMEYVGALGLQEIAPPAHDAQSLTVPTPAASIEEDTAGVRGTYRGVASEGATLLDTTNGNGYRNAGTTDTPVWTIY